jgi:fatty acid desaturase
MLLSLEKFKNMPSLAKIGISFWLLSWVWFIAVYYYYTKDTDWVLKLSIAVGILSLFLSQAQNWARLISILANSMGILLSVIFFYKGLALIAALNLVFFSGAIYLLMVSPTTAYFKSQSQSGNPSDDK